MKKIAPFLVVGAVALCSLVIAQPNVALPAKPPKIELAAVKLPDEAMQKKLIALFEAIEADDYANFTRAITDEFKTALPKKLFATVTTAFAPRLAKGYDLAYMGEIRKGEFKTYVWKIIFRDGGDDVLATMSLKSVPNAEEQATEKVGGLFLS